MQSPGRISSPLPKYSAPHTRFVCAAPPYRSAGEVGEGFGPGRRCRGTGTVRGAEHGGAAAVGCPQAGSTGNLQLARVREQIRPPYPPSLACLRAMSPGSREGAGECLGWAEGPRVEEAGVSLSPARPLSRLGKVGRGRAGISALGEGIPALERRAGALHWLPGRGVSPVPKDWHTLLPPAREPGVGAPAGTAKGGARGAGLRLSPSPGFRRSANPTAPPAPPGSRAFSERRQRPFGKVCIAAGWSSGPPGARSRPGFFPDLSRGGAGPRAPALARDFQECALTARDAPAVGPGGWDSRPARQPPARSAGSLGFSATKSVQSAVGSWGGS